MRGTVTAVAEALSYSPSSVSEQLAELERQTGARLFERVGRNLRLTEAGRVLVVHAADLLSRMERAEAEVAAVGTAVHGVVRVGSCQSAAIELLPPMLRRLATSHPQLQVDVVGVETEPAMRALALHELDLLIATEHDQVPVARDPTLDREDLLREPMLLALPASHPAGEGGMPVSIAALRDEPWAAGSPETDHAALVAHACNALGGFDPRIRHRADDLHTLLGLVRSGAAVTLIPRMMLGHDGDDTVCAHPVAEGDLNRLIFLASRRDGLVHPALLAVRNALLTVCGERG